MVRLLSTPRGLPATHKIQDVLKKSFYFVPIVTVEHLSSVYRGTTGGFAVGYNGILLDYHDADEEWRVHKDSPLVATDLWKVEVFGAGLNVAVLGSSGVIVRGIYNAVTEEYDFVLDPQSGVITLQSLNGCVRAYAQLGIGADRLIAVGYGGTVLIYDAASWGATTWTQVSFPVADYLTSVHWNWTTSGTLAVAVGLLGGIYHSTDDGDTWTLEYATGVSMVDVYVVTTTDVWACGFDGSMFHYDGTSWSAVAVPTEEILNSVWLLATDEGYCVGNYGTILHWDGDVWERAASPTAQALADVHGGTINRLAIVGAVGTTLNYFGDIVPIQPIDRGGVVQPRPLNEEPTETQVFDDEEIRDAVAHNSDIANVSRFKVITIHVSNTLDQQVSIVVKVNRVNSTTGATTVGAAFNVAALTGIEARVLTQDTSGWLPYVFIEATAAGVPTLGNVNAYIIGRN